MPITKNSTEALLSLQLTIKRLWESIVDMKLRLDYLCNHIEWKDKVGQNFIEQYHQNMKVVQDKLLPKFDRYNQYLCQLIKIVDEYSDEINSNIGIAGTPSNKPLSNQGYLSADNGDFQKDTKERLQRIAIYAEMPKNQHEFLKMKQKEVINNLNEAIRREDSIAYHEFRLSHPNNHSLSELKKETKIKLTDDFLIIENRGRYNSADNIIYVNKEFAKIADNISLFGVIMHEYEHKQQYDAALRNEVSMEYWKEIHRVSDDCKLEFNNHNMTGANIDDTCQKQIDDYFNDSKEKRSRKAGEIARDFFRPKVLYRNPKLSH